MPVNPDHIDALAATLAHLFEDAETALVALITRNLERGMDAPTWVPGKYASIRTLRRATTAIAQELNRASGDRLRDIVADAYRSGWRTAFTELPPELRQDIADAQTKTPNLEALEALAESVHRDTGVTSSNILRTINDAFRQVQAAAAGRVLAGIQTRIQASQAAWTTLARKGILDFVDKSGRRWKLSSYVEMAARTVTQRAAIQGQTDRLIDLGHDLVVVSDAPQECLLCRPFEQKILRITPGPTGDIIAEHALTGQPVIVHVTATLEAARAEGFQHPNCRHSISIYLPGVTKRKNGTADPAGDQARQRQRALERRIRNAKTSEQAAFTDEAKTKARRDIRKAQAALREHLTAHTDLKRLRYREQIGAGSRPPAGADHHDTTAFIRPDL